MWSLKVSFLHSLRVPFLQPSKMWCCAVFGDSKFTLGVGVHGCLCGVWGMVAFKRSMCRWYRKISADTDLVKHRNHVLLTRSVSELQIDTSNLESSSKPKRPLQSLPHCGASHHLMTRGPEPFDLKQTTWQLCTTWDLFLVNCRQRFIAGDCLTVQKQIVLFKGRWKLLQKLKSSYTTKDQRRCRPHGPDSWYLHLQASNTEVAHGAVVQHSWHTPFSQLSTLNSGMVLLMHDGSPWLSSQRSFSHPTREVDWKVNCKARSLKQWEDVGWQEPQLNHSKDRKRAKQREKGVRSVQVTKTKGQQSVWELQCTCVWSQPQTSSLPQLHTVRVQDSYTHANTFSRTRSCTQTLLHTLTHVSRVLKMLKI